MKKQTGQNNDDAPLGVVTLQDIADQASVSRNTVSLALRNSSRISKETRKRIRKIADKLGYKPNPLLSIYQSNLRHKHPVMHTVTVGWIQDYALKENLKGKKEFYSNRALLLQGAKERAKTLGITIDVIETGSIRINNPQFNVKNFCKMLNVRNIFGIILPIPHVKAHAVTEWENVAVTVIGSSFSETESAHHHRMPPYSKYHQVLSDHFHNFWLAWNHLWKLGYRRIGLALFESQYRESCFHSVACYTWIHEVAQPKPEKIPHLIVHGNVVEFPYPRKVFDDFKAWYNQYKPEVIIVRDNRFKDMLETMGLSVPEDVGLFHLSVRPNEAGWSGIDEMEIEQGAAALDIMFRQLRLNERSMPEQVRTTTIRGQVIDGATTRTTSQT